MTSIEFINEREQRTCTGCHKPHQPGMKFVRKDRTLGLAISQLKYASLAKVQAELDKCDLVCADCRAREKRLAKAAATGERISRADKWAELSELAALERVCCKLMAGQTPTPSDPDFYILGRAQEVITKIRADAAKSTFVYVPGPDDDEPTVPEPKSEMTDEEKEADEKAWLAAHNMVVTSA